MSARKKLMEEIYDQFLVCKICHDVYSRPKTLTCLHTFCETCISKQHDAERQRAYRCVPIRRCNCCICCSISHGPLVSVHGQRLHFLRLHLKPVARLLSPDFFSTCSLVCGVHAMLSSHISVSCRLQFHFVLVRLLQH